MRQTDALATKLIDRLRAVNLPIQLVAAFTNTQPGTVGNWLSKGQPPRGERLNRLQHLLDALDIASPELVLVSEYCRYLGRLMAFDIISLEETRQMLGVSADQKVFMTIRGERDPWRDAVGSILPSKTLEQLRDEFDGRLTEAEADIRRQFAEQGYSIVAGAAAKTMAPPKPSPVAIPVTPDASAKFDFILESARTLGSILPLARHLASDACTPEDRALLRDLLGDEGMFELSNLINQLCGERARNSGR